METWRGSNETVVIPATFTYRSSALVATTEEPEYVSETVEKLLKAKRVKPVPAPVTAKKFMEWLDTK